MVFLLGYVENPEEAKWAAPGCVNKERALSLRARFDTDEKVAAELAALRARWDDLLGRFTVDSGEEKLDRMVNIWNQYQCMVTCNMARSASYFESGIGRGIGFRDTSQDLLGCVHQVPDRARQRLFDVASTQFQDGGAWHQYQPLTKRGNADVGGGFNDDPLWLILGVAGYLKETRRLGLPRRAGAVRQRRGKERQPLRAPEALLRPRPAQPRPARAAPHRPRRLERLPQSQLLLHRPERVLPDHDEQGRAHGGVGAHRRDVRAHRRRLRRDLPAHRARRGGARRGGGHRAHALRRAHARMGR